MDNCGICSKPALQLFETGKEGVYACFKCQPLVPEVTIEDNGEQSGQMQHLAPSMEIEIQIETSNDEELMQGMDGLNCGICHKTFQKNAQLQNHLRNHLAERRFVCTYCNKAFSQSNNLRAHLRIHTNERPYKCSECGKAFTQVTNLNNHVRLHTGERPFVCPEPGCTKAYAQVTNLNQHRKRHLNGRPVEASYDCPVCGERFTQRNHMYTHRRDAHAEVVSPPARRHVCKLCDLALPSERLLHDHVATHVAAPAPSPAAPAAAATAPDDEQGDDDSDESFSCVFRSCGARLSSAHEHTEHLLSAHQLRVLAARTPHPPRRGRPPKVKVTATHVAQHKIEPVEEEQDPLEIKEPQFRPIKIVNASQFGSKLKVQRLFN